MIIIPVMKLSHGLVKLRITVPAVVDCSHLNLLFNAASKTICLHVDSRTASPNSTSRTVCGNLPTKCNIYLSESTGNTSWRCVCNNHVYDRAPARHSSRCRFLPRDAMRKRGLCCRPVSVCLSRWCIVSTRLKILSNLFLCLLALSF